MSVPNLSPAVAEDGGKAKMAAGKRMLLALVCVLLAVLISGLISSVSLLRYGWRYTLPVVEILPVYLLSALPGWVLALPFVLLFKDAEGWRAGAILFIGMAIGPALMGGWSLFWTHGRLDWQADGFFVVAAFWIGTLTPVLYLVLLRRFGRRRLVRAGS